MKIIDRLNEDRINISFEVFPPKTDAGFANVQRATDEIAKLDPSYISVTYGAGGGTSKNTAKIASHIKDDLHVLSLAHLTCASSTKEEVREVIRNLKELGIENILALRGDIPEGMKFPDGDRFHYAYELVEEIRKQGDFCIGAACYPEGHVENEHKEDDIRFLKQKVDCGVDFLTTQMFFDNDIHYNFLYRIREAGITPRYVHCCNTGATAWLKEAYSVCTHVRTGSLYLGYSSIQNDWNPIGVEESGSWKTMIVNIREIVPGESVGYGRTFMPDHPAKVAVIGIGYGDGYTRSFAVSGAPAIINGVRCRFVGTCMDMSFLDVTGVDCKIGDEVTLFGEDGKGNRISGLEIGHLMGETRLAMFSHITERAARTYSLDDGKTYLSEEDYFQAIQKQL